MESSISYEQYYEIAYDAMRIMNPIPEHAFAMFADLAGLHSASRVLDIGSGKGYTALALAMHCGAHSTQVDYSVKWTDYARALFVRNNLIHRTSIQTCDARDFRIEPEGFDMIVCLGNSPIYGGFADTVQQFLPGLKKDGFLLMGEATVREDIPSEYRTYLEDMEWMLPTEEELLLVMEEYDLHIHYARRSSIEEWDQYMGMQWNTVRRFIRKQPDNPVCPDLEAWLSDEQESYLRFQRHFVDWTVFLLCK